jgi:transcriptional regulator with XRE-family HTH domain
MGVRELARAAGVTANTVSRIENGKGALRSTLLALREALERAGAEFVTGGVVERKGAALAARPASDERERTVPGGEPPQGPRYVGWRAGHPLETVASTLRGAIGNLDVELFANDSSAVKAAKWEIEDAIRKLQAGETYVEKHPGIEPASEKDRAA